MKLTLSAASVLLLVACDAGAPAPEPNVAKTVDDSAQTQDGTDTAKPEEKTPEVADADDWLQPGRGELVLLPVERERVRIVLPWQASSHEDRRKRLEELAERGSEWAKETLRKLDDGEMHPSELDDSADTVAEESLNHPPKRLPGSDNGCAPMPFGGSMFGPWDTGGTSSP